MSTTAHLRPSVLFVDDDPRFLELMDRIMSVFSEGRWTIAAAETAGQALGLLHSTRIDLVVVDVQMPVVDGLQFLALLNRKHPNLMKAVLTAYATNESYRAACLSHGAELFLEKPKTPGEQHSLYAALNELLKWRPEQGFQGVLRRVGLHDVIQMECLGRNSSILEVLSGNQRGRIFIRDGSIVHAASGSLKGELAFNQLLTLKGGEFHLLPFAEPPECTIDGSWEFLLMEAARMRDEGESATPEPAPAEPPTPAIAEPEPSVQLLPEAASQPTPATPEQPALEPAPPATPPASAPPGEAPDAALASDDEARVIDEMLICSAEGEVVYEWQCPNSDVWIHFFEFISRKSRQLTQGLNVGAFSRLQFSGANTRAVARVSGRQGVLVRSHLANPDTAPLRLVASVPGSLSDAPGTLTAERRAVFKDWLLALPHPEGFQAAGLRFPDKTALSESGDRGFPLPAIEQTWRGIADTFKVLDLHRLPADRMLWFYRDAWLLAVRRPDGIILNLLVRADAAPSLAAEFDRLWSAFLALPVQPAG